MHVHINSLVRDIGSNESFRYDNGVVPPIVSHDLESVDYDPIERRHIIVVEPTKTPVPKNRTARSVPKITSRGANHDNGAQRGNGKVGIQSDPQMMEKKGPA